MAGGSPPNRTSPPRAWIAALAVALATAAVHWPVTGNGFIEIYDDGPYVLHNPKVRAGLTGDGVAWAFTSVHVHNWHPLTWISHMADVQAFGIEPAGHHRTSVLLHAANAALLVLLFAALGAPVLAAAMAGAFFGVHPLRLESVAWVAERKDVLSGLFFFLALLAWIRHARKPGPGPYLAALGSFALGLLAKPVLVTLPAVLLLLDLWPLRRVRLGGGPEERARWKAEALRLAPFAALSVVVAIVTILAQGVVEGMPGIEGFPMTQRVANAATSVFAYLGKMAWPSGLSVYYPHPHRALLSPLPLLALAGIAAATAGAIAAWRAAPWLLVGWLWYLAMLVPVSGLVQVGRLGMADRYTYLPGVGILLACTWAVLALLGRFPSRTARGAAVAASTAAVAALALATVRGAADWQTSQTLFESSRSRIGPTTIASNGLGALAAQAGRMAEAERLFREAIAADPDFGPPRQNLATLLLKDGRIDEGRREAEVAVRLSPRSADSRFVLGLLLELQGQVEEARSAYEQTLRLAPRHAMARDRLARLRPEVNSRIQTGEPR